MGRFPVPKSMPRWMRSSAGTGLSGCIATRRTGTPRSASGPSRYGDDHVFEWATNRVKAMYEEIKRFEIDLANQPHQA
jgi:hypothetical protein